MTRSVDELLKLDTYQGMTDEEITSIIDFKCKCAADTARVEADHTALEDTLTGMRECANRSRAHSKAMFDAAIASTPIFRTVGENE